MQLRKLWHRHGNGFHWSRYSCDVTTVRSDGVRKRSGEEKNEIKGRGKEAEIKQNIVDEFRNAK